MLYLHFVSFVFCQNTASGGSISIETYLVSIKRMDSKPDIGIIPLRSSAGKSFSKIDNSMVVTMECGNPMVVSGTLKEPLGFAR